MNPTLSIERAEEKGSLDWTPGVPVVVGEDIIFLFCSLRMWLHWMDLYQVQSGGECMKCAEFLFTVGNALILPCWALILFFPRSKVTDRVFRRSGFSPLHLLALFYVLAVVPALLASPESLVALARPTLEGVMGLLGSESGAAAGWIHYLCFDLFVGVSVWRTAGERAHSFLWVSPVLATVLMLGPMGWLTYELISKVVLWRKS